MVGRKTILSFREDHFSGAILVQGMYLPQCVPRLLLHVGSLGGQMHFKTHHTLSVWGL